MEKINFDEFNRIQEGLLKQFGNIVLKTDNESSAYEEATLYFHNYLNQLKKDFSKLCNDDSTFEKSNRILFLKNLQMMLFAFKYGIHFSDNLDLVNTYNADDNNFFDMMLFLKDKNCELALFQLSLEESQDNPKLNLTFYDDYIANYQLDKKSAHDIMAKVNKINELKQESQAFLNKKMLQQSSDVDYSWALRGKICDIKDEEIYLFDQIYRKIQNNDAAALYILRKNILRDTFLEMGIHNEYFKHFKQQQFSDSKSKKLLKSFPYIDVHCDIKNN